MLHGFHNVKKFGPYYKIWCENDLSSGQLSKIMSPSNSPSHMTIKPESTETCATFSFGDLIWPDVNLSSDKVCNWMPPFSTFWQALDSQLLSVPSLQQIVRNVAILTILIWLVIFFRIFSKLIYKVFVESFRLPPHPPCYVHWYVSQAGEWAESAPSLSAGRVLSHTSIACG